MKKFICVLAVLVCLCLCATALAEPTVRKLDSSVSLNRETGVLAVQDRETRTYMLTTPEGEVLTTEPYTGIYAKEYGFFKVEVASEDGVHDEGLIDSTGRVIIPPEYADIDVVSERWQTGVKLTPCEADDKDYTFFSFGSDEKKYFRIDTVDFFFDGQKVGTLGRSDYGSYAQAYGAYVRVSDRGNNGVFYNSAMERSPAAGSYGEYDNSRVNGEVVYTHNGSGQTAFAPGCTLTADEVKQSALYKDGAFYDLQGNEICRAARDYDNVYDIGGGYSRVSLYNDGKTTHGVINAACEEIIPPEYDEVGLYGKTLNLGYIGVEKDGKFGYVDVNGNVTCDFVYSADIVDDHGTFAELKNLDGTIIVLSAAVGELPEHYADVQFIGYEGSMVFAAKNAEGAWGIVGLNGETVVPFSADISYVSDMSRDGRVVIIEDNDYDYYVYMIDEADLDNPRRAARP